MDQTFCERLWMRKIKYLNYSESLKQWIHVELKTLLRKYISLTNFVQLKSEIFFSIPDMSAICTPEVELPTLSLDSGQLIPPLSSSSAPVATIHLDPEHSDLFTIVNTATICHNLGESHSSTML